jgi:hypothetical protein
MNGTLDGGLTTNVKNKLLLRFESPNADIDIMIEDDGRAAYAYLREGGKIVGDVWLYNSGVTPVRVPWTSNENMPFANPADYVKEQDFSPIQSADDVAVEWQDYEERPAEAVILKKQALEAVISIRGERHAVLKSGSLPGWCKLARKDGPLAKVMEHEPPRV